MVWVARKEEELAFPRGDTPAASWGRAEALEATGFPHFGYSHDGKMGNHGMEWGHPIAVSSRLKCCFWFHHGWYHFLSPWRFPASCSQLVSYEIHMIPPNHVTQPSWQAAQQTVRRPVAAPWCLSLPEWDGLRLSENINSSAYNECDTGRNDGWKGHFKNNIRVH